MDSLEYTVLLEAYERALELKLEEDFIQILREEINGRKSTIVQQKAKMFV
ncbi:sporulation histidine kinase inhibitor Sda [Halalkalibacter kiskunsagensis]|uniref:Sporulation histidine kinase inhibitor Sda n=1 Tax=Halalkalibacter kiskunsagensis TaxID=1548599 RepID=A0ABV6KJD1_9BACI